MKLFKKIAIAAALSVTSAMTVGVAAAQDYMTWNDIDPYGSLMYDQWGNEHRVDPYAYDSVVDIYGNVYSSDYGIDNSLDTYDLTFNNPTASTWDTGSSSTYVPYESPVDSHQAFINSIWE